MKRQSISVQAIAVLAFVLICTAPIGCGITFAAQPTSGGVLRIATYTDGNAIGYPPESTRGPILGMCQSFPAVETLFRPDKTGLPVPWLASSAKEDTKENTLVIGLKKGIKFHDGTDFTAEAVKWNIDQHLAVKGPGTEMLRSVDVLDPYTVRLNLVEWDNRIMSSLTAQLGMMISPTACKKNGKEWAAKHPVGTGPFEFVSWEKDVRTTCKKFAGYWQKGKPYLDRIEWNIIGETFTRESALKSGEMDVILFPAPSDVAGLQKDGFVVTRHMITAGARGGVFDSANPKSPFHDLRVRQAAQYAIDAEAIVKALFQGEAEATNQFNHKAHWGYNPSIVGYPYNPAKAKQLLAEAGYPNGFKTKLLPRIMPMDQSLFTIVQGYLKAIGIDAQLDPQETPRFNQRALGGGGWEGILEDVLPPDPDLPGFLADKYSGRPGFFVSMLVPDDYKQALLKAIKAPNFREKQKWTQEALKLMTDKYCLCLVLVKDNDLVVSKASVHDTGIDEFMSPTVWTPESAWMQR